jgi:hypothetical protein
METRSCSHSDVEDHLLDLLKMVNDWLRFAETKNGGLLALTGLSASALLGFAAQAPHINPSGAWVMAAAGVLWGIAFLVTLGSFLPKTDLLNIVSRLEGVREEPDNLYYFGHLARLDAASLLAALGADPRDGSPRARFERDAAEQVIVNSRITVDKLAAFQVAAKCWGVGLVVAVIGILIAVWR